MSILTPLQTCGHIYLREPATVVPGPVPEQYEFLKAPIPPRKYRINFRHPAYAPDDNILFTLYAWDHAEGGIHHGLAHNACSIFADNRTDGYLSRTCDGEHGEPILAAWDDVLPATVEDYYFYIPYPPGRCRALDKEDTTNILGFLSAEPSVLPNSESRPPYRWPVVATFQDWTFPRNLPEIWTRCARTQRAASNTAPQSNLTSAVRQRDVTCRITAFESGTEVAHLIPEHESQWFLSNSMARWNSDLTLDPDNLLRDLSNAVLLRSDIHAAFDQRKFVFFPKGPEGFVLHMLVPTSDIGQLYHNTPLNIPQCCLEFLFARFAWSIFPSLSGFLSRPSRSRLVLRLKAGTGERVAEELTNAVLLGRKATASRSNSPTKRSRMAADMDNVDVEYVSKRQRICEATSARSSFNSTLPTLKDVDEVEHLQRPPSVHTTKDARFMSHLDSWKTVALHGENGYIEELRQEALAQQRPAGYNPQRPPYDKHRPAKEELELMGVEIIPSLDDLDFSDDAL